MQSYIEKRWAKTPKDLSVKLDVSERTVLRMINHLKEKGIKIRFSRKTNEYFID
jgi:Mn-dependent DtxR family transcriptional regulator